MHIPDGLLANNVNYFCGAVSLSALYCCNRAAIKEADDSKLSIAGAVTAFVFAAQMINFPIAFGASGHFLGAFFLALVLGPHLGFISMAVILLIQAIFFADGGIVAWGSNLFNMGIAGGLLPYAAFKLVHKSSPFFSKKRGFILLSSAAGYASVVAASFCCGLEIGLSKVAGVYEAVCSITFIHLVIALGEAAILSATLGLLSAAMPELFEPYVGSGADKTPENGLGESAAS